MIYLKKFEKPDYDRLINWVDSEELMVQFSGPVFQYPLTHEQLNKYVSAENRLAYKVIDPISGEIIGTCRIEQD